MKPITPNEVAVTQRTKQQPFLSSGRQHRTRRRILVTIAVLIALAALLSPFIFGSSASAPAKHPVTSQAIKPT